MKDEHTDDTFLSRWLNNDLTSEELVSFQQTPTYKEYNKIAKAMDKFEAPTFQKETVFQSVKNKTAKTKVKKLVPSWMYAAAASVALLFSVVYFLTNSNETFSTSFGEQLAVVLPDGSEVQLNSKSTLTFKKSDWYDGNRTLTLEGEGYFKVNKGSKFSVNTINGKVSVLGTQFNIKSSPTYFDVKCFEGKVQVQNKNETAILTKGLSFRKIENNSTEKGSFKNNSPFWIRWESSFNSTPIKYVIEELQKQYDITIATDGINLDTLFTGTFSNKDLNLALQTICIPMSIQFELAGKKVTLKK
jgi:ferric-dicitrate binding protein FerR (iron transport regulator)